MTSSAQPSVPVLKFRTTLLDPPPTGDLLSALPVEGGVAWLREGQGMVGWGESARVDIDGPDHFGSADAWWQAVVERAHIDDEVGARGTGAVVFGSFAFDAAASSSVLLVPRVIVGHVRGTWWITTVDGADDVVPAPAGPSSPRSVIFSPGSRSDAEWKATVAEAVRRIRSGDLQKVVLARDVEARLDHDLDVRWPVRRLAEGYPECWTFLVDGLMGASPEPVLRLQQGVARSRVLAGTRPRPAEVRGGLAEAESLVTSAKDLEEHRYSVASVTRSLARHCSTVEVPDRPAVLELPNLTHLATDVRGTVSDGSSALRLLGDLHPTAAVCGTPTAAAMDLIREIEGLARGRYAGPVGWVDASGEGDWCIALRCAQVDPEDSSRLRLFGGGGIVRQSVPEEELAESNAKLLPVMQALGGQGAVPVP